MSLTSILKETKGLKRFHNNFQGHFAQLIQPKIQLILGIYMSAEVMLQYMYVLYTPKVQVTHNYRARKLQEFRYFS